MLLMSSQTYRCRVVGFLVSVAVVTSTPTAAASESCSTRALLGLQEQAGAAFSVKAPALSISIKDQAKTSSAWKMVDGALIATTAATPLFHVGSITKTFTAALVLLLDQEQQLSINEPVNRWINLPKAGGVTVAMLLEHTSGIPDILDLPGHAAEDSPENSLGHIAKADLLFSPGSRWGYSNSNYLLLGLIIERVTGVSYSQLLSERLLDPLGLTNTYLWGAKGRSGVLPGFRLACGGSGEGKCQIGERYPLHRVDNGRDWRVAWSAGGLVSNSADLSAWMQALTQGPLLDEAHRKLLMTPTALSVEGLTELGRFEGVRWRSMGMGLMQFIFEDGSEAWGHSGYIDGFSAIAAAGEDLPSVAITTALQQANVYELAASGLDELDCWIDSPIPEGK
jgi:D-alanyl-D-alanine carboxypeptidase